MPNDVTMPGGKVCKGGTCKQKAAKILGTKISNKKKYSIGKGVGKAKPGTPPVGGGGSSDDAYPKEKMLLSVKNTVAGEGTTTDYDADDTPSARAEANKKYAGSGKYVK